MPGPNGVLDWQDTVPGGGVSGLIGNTLPSSSASVLAPTIAALGDSITGFNISVTSAERSFSAFGYLSWAQVLLNQRIDFRPEWNFGVSGDRLDQIYKRVGSVINVKPAFCCVLGGTNDVAQDIPQATMRQSMTNIVNALRGAGITPIVYTIFPRTGLTTAQLQNLCSFNTWLRNTYGATRYVLVCDVFRRWADPASATSAPLTGYTQDGVHPSQTGAYFAATVFRDLMNNILPPRPVFWPGNADTHDITNNPLGNLVSNAGFTTTTTPGTGLTGTTATNWTASRTLGTSTGQAIVVQSRTDGVPGNEIQLTINVSAVSATEEWRIRQGFNAGASTYQAGDTVYGQMEVDVSASTNVRWLFVYLDDNNGSSVVTTGRALSSASFSSPTAAWSGTLRTPNYVVSPYSGTGTQNLSLGIAMAVDGSTSATVTLKIRSPECRKVIAS